MKCCIVALIWLEHTGIQFAENAKDDHWRKGRREHGHPGPGIEHEGRKKSLLKAGGILTFQRRSSTYRGCLLPSISDRRVLTELLVVDAPLRFGSIRFLAFLGEREPEPQRQSGSVRFRSSSNFKQVRNWFNGYGARGGTGWTFVKIFTGLIFDLYRDP